MLISTRKFDPQALLDAVDAERRARGLTWADLSAQFGISTTTIRNMPKRRWGIELDGVIGLCRWLGRTVESFAGGDGGPPPRPASYAETGRVIRFDTRALHAAVSEERVRRGLTWDQAALEIWPVLSEHPLTRVEGPVLSERPLTRVEGPVLSERSLTRVEGPVLSERPLTRVEGPVLSEPSLTRVEGPSGPWGADQLKRLAKGGRADVYSALAICGWLGRTIQSFSRETPV